MRKTGYSLLIIFWNYGVNYSEFEQKILVLETENRLLREQSERSTTAVEDIAKQPRINTTNNNHLKFWTEDGYFYENPNEIDLNMFVM